MTIVVAITGAQGVGKSTFCSAVEAELRGLSFSVDRAKQLGPILRAKGIALGATSTSSTIPSVFAAHIERELAEKEKDGVVLYDRCAADALAYVRALRLSSPDTVELCEHLTNSLLARVDLILVLRLSATFEPEGGPHETIDLRREIDRLVLEIVEGTGRPFLALDAADSHAVGEAVKAIRKAF